MVTLGLRRFMHSSRRIFLLYFYFTMRIKIGWSFFYVDFERNATSADRTKAFSFLITVHSDALFTEARNVGFIDRKLITYAHNTNWWGEITDWDKSGNLEPDHWAEQFLTFLVWRGWRNVGRETRKMGKINFY